MTILAFLLGLLALVAGAELLVRGASRLADALGLSPLVIGVTVVSFGTSAPEAAVSIGAALDGRGELALGNVVGSNIVNVLIILGISAAIVPLAVHRQLIRQEVPVMIGACVLFAAQAFDGRIGRADGLLLALLLVGYTAFLVRGARADAAAAGETSAAPAGETSGGHSSEPARGQAAGRTRAAALREAAIQIGFVIAGLVLLVGGAQALVGAATSFARALGVSELVIGLTIVAVGTSLPELAASVAAALRGHGDLAVGNVVGSNVFNLLGCAGLAAALSPDGLVVPEALRHFDLLVMIAVALACLPIFFSGHRIDRWEGVLLAAYGAAYLAYTLLAASQHDALPAFSGAMLGFVVPLTVVAIVATVISRAGGPPR